MESGLRATPVAEPAKEKPKPWRNLWKVAPTALLVIAADQVSKYMVRANLAVGEAIPATGTFRILHIHNTGGAFGFFGDQTFFLIIASLVAIAVLVVLYRHYPFSGPLVRLALGLQLGGAIGNLVDRVRLGYVTDFVQLGWWPLFNVADASIDAGIVILVYLFLFSTRGKKAAPDDQETAPSRDGPQGTDGQARG